MRLNEANPLEMPGVGSCGLHILAPNLLELTLITTKDPDPAQAKQWNFVTASAQWNGPAASAFTVTAGGQQIEVAQVGFKRRPLYAPLKQRDLRIASCLYLNLAQPLGDTQTVEVTNPDGQLWPGTVHFTATMDPLRWSPAIHANQVGYAPTFPKKAMVGYYLGSLGEMSIPTAQGFQLVDGAGKVVFQGELTRRTDRGYVYEPLPYLQVWEADFTSFQAPGEYRLLVPDLGTSFPFRIDEGIPAAFARTYALGVFHQRCGMKEELPFTRFIHDVCHAAPAQIPTMSFTAVNAELANMTGDFANYQTAPRLKDVNSSLYPFLDLSDRDVSGGHHDAGDYSKYTINSAGFIHYLVFAADAFPGVASLDNLGLPESGDGKSDILQEAKWEADFLAKMQDRDGGFFFLVYPRDREYEDDVLPDKGDPQVVFPKTTSVTAAAVAALAEAGSSPQFKQQFPNEASQYLAKAKLGWSFLMDAIAKHGKAGAYQKITHYGNEFAHDDELAWAACALFAATGDPAYHQQLKAWYDPSDPNTRRWTWWRLFEGYGCAVRTYAFAARSGRLPSSALDPVYLSKCEAEIKAAAADHVHFAQESAYGTTFPDFNKAQLTAGWYFSSERAFDITVAYQLTPRADYLEAIVGNLNYESGCNPVNVAYITGIGSRRQREIVHQYAQNDRRVLPPSGLPLGNIQAGFQYLDNYLRDLEEVTFPSDASETAPYPYYDRWGDSFNTTTEFVITDQARSLASLSFWMAQSSLRTQPWKSGAGQITGLPIQTPAHQSVTATLAVPDVDLTGARIVWEGKDQEPQFGNPVTFEASSAGDQWVEVEAQMPDGRRIFVSTNFMATTGLDTPPNRDESAPVPVTSDLIALYHLDGDLSDATGKQSALSLNGNATFDSSNLGWMANRQGSTLHFQDLGDSAIVQIRGSSVAPNETSAMVIEAMVYIDSFVAYNRDSARIVSLADTWNAFLEFGEDKYAGPYVRGGTQLEMLDSAVTTNLTSKVWHHLAIEINQTGYVVRVDGATIRGVSSSEFANWGRGMTATLELGNFNGWIDEVAVRSSQGSSSSTQSSPETVATPVISPNGGASSSPLVVTLSTSTSDAVIRFTTDGSEPTASSTIYGGPFTLNNSATIQARAFKTGLIDSALASANFVVTSNSSTGSRAVLDESDSLTKGDWKGRYGADGYSIFEDKSKMPSYLRLSASGNNAYTWSDSTADARALQRASSTNHIASCWYASGSFTINLNFTDGNTHQLALYFLDWDRLGRSEKVELLDGANNTVLTSLTLSNFSEGRYLVCHVQGHMKVRLTRITGPNAVVMGLFFDPIPQSKNLATAPSLSLKSEVSATSTVGWKLHLSGQAGQTYLIENTTDLQLWTAVGTNTLSAAELDLPNVLIRNGAPNQFFRARSISGVGNE